MQEPAPFKAASVTKCPRSISTIVRCSAAEASNSRRQALQLAALIAAAPIFSPSAALADRAPKGFVGVKDGADGYAFLYPFGWQEVTVDGQDIVFKDVIEPLESVSVGMVPTDKKDIDEFGPVQEVTLTLADKVLTSPQQTVELVKAEERVVDGRKYYDFEFTAKASNYTRHACASVTVGNGKFYTLVSGANERRWNKMQDKITTSVKSFTVVDVY